MRRRRLQYYQLEEGFTLIETLVALALLALLSGLFLSMLTQFRALKSTQTRLELRAEVDSAVRHVSTVIGAARMLPLQQRGNDDFHVMIGEENRLKLVAVVRTGASDVGLREVEILQVTSDVDSQSALYERHMLRGRETDRPAEPVLEAAILDEDSRIELSYFSRNESGEMIKSSDWKSTDLPVAILVTVQLRRGDESVSSSRVVSLTPG